MKRIISILFISISFWSCSNDDESNGYCLDEAKEIILRSDGLIEAENCNQLQIGLQIRNRDLFLEDLNCNNDCLDAIKEILHRYDMLIELENCNQTQIELLIRNRDLELDELDC